MSLHPLCSPRRLVAAAATLAALAGPAQAGLISGVYDPAFGPPFGGLGWKGKVFVDIPDACLALGTADFSNPECLGSTVVSARVALYNLSSPSVDSLLNFSSTSQLPLISNGDVDVLDFYSSTLRLSLNNVYVVGGQLIGLSTDLRKTPFAPFSTAFPGDWAAPGGTLSTPAVVAAYAQYLYGLSINPVFDSTGTTVVGSEASLRAGSTVAGDPVDPLLGCPWDGDYNICSSRTNPTVTFTPVPPPSVPEPGALLLVGAALAAAAGARRVKRRQPA